MPNPLIPAAAEGLPREILRYHAEAAIEYLIALLDEMDGDSDAEPECEDEGAQCDDEGGAREEDLHYIDDGRVQAWHYHSQAASKASMIPKR